jgi:hypothetical protein
MPADVQAPRSLLNEILARIGYIRLRTSVAAHGLPVPDVQLYRPLFSPWEGEPAFKEIFQRVKDHHSDNICGIKGGKSVLSTHRRRHLPKRA